MVSGGTADLRCLHFPAAQFAAKFKLSAVKLNKLTEYVQRSSGQLQCPAVKSQHRSVHTQTQSGRQLTHTQDK